MVAVLVAATNLWLQTAAVYFYTLLSQSSRVECMRVFLNFDFHWYIGDTSYNRSPEEAARYDDMVDEKDTATDRPCRWQT